MEYRPGEYVLLEYADRRVAPRSYSIANAPRTEGSSLLLVRLVARGQLAMTRLREAHRQVVFALVGEAVLELAP
ncbi:MAG TPA: FAD-binding oxidoreductase, partial [Solirubrobacteraceae bacterium]